MQNFLIFLSHQWLLATALLVLIIALFWLETQGSVSGMKRITPPAAIDLINKQDATVFDIRDKQAFNKGHIANSKHLLREDLKTKKMDKYKDKPIILVCYSGVSVQKLAPQLKKLGFTQAYFMQGGITAWQNANLPLVKK